MSTVSPGLKKRILSVLFILLIVVISMIIFVHRERLQYVEGLGYAGVFILCFICNATVLAPAPSLLVVLTASTFLNPLLVSITGASGTTLGELTGYASGFAGNNIKDIQNNKITKLLEKYGTVIIFIFAFLPLPLFDIVGVASGYFKVKLYYFLIACFLGKLLKMLLYVYGIQYVQKLLPQSLQLIIP